MKSWNHVFGFACAIALLLGAGAVQGTNAFLDAQQITYIEAVNRAAEKGLFAGIDGNFQPEGSVTRAQMATIIVKILHGSDYNADAHKGTGRFPDTADFESGWAEGYINLCAQDGVVAGYGDGTFQPGNKVTAAEAVTMLLNAMNVDAGVGSWPTTVMKKADELQLFAGLREKPDENEVLNREQLAVLVMAGLDWQEKEQADGTTSSDSASSGSSSNGSSTGGSSSGGSSSGGSYSGGSSSGGSYSGGSSSGGSSTGGSSSGGSSSGGSSSGGSSSNGSSSDSSSGGSSDDASSEGPEKPGDDEKEPWPVLGVEADKADLTADNVFLLSATLAEDKKTVEVTLTLQGKVGLCGFDMVLQYDNNVYSLRELDTEHDLTLFSYVLADQGCIMFNYAGATNITKEKTVLTAVFDVVGQPDEESVFSMPVGVVIKTDETQGYEVSMADYTLTWCRPQ